MIYVENIESLHDLGIAFCSELPYDIIMMNGIIYVRLHVEKFSIIMNILDEKLNEIIKSINRLYLHVNVFI